MSGDSRKTDNDPGRIRRLSDALINQIAAGEVVERPASVVKELVENSLDAGAKRVRVDIRDGGISWIAVVDDGEGMSPGDAELAIQRHATSKLRIASDLESIASFGFRGEALPSIAAVSRFRLLTRRRGAESAWEIRADSGRVTECREAGGPEGTRVEVADLFHGVPARRKFLKRPGTEWGHVSDWLTRVALVLPAVHFEVRRDERPAWIWPATADPLDRIAAVLSEQEAAGLVGLEASADGVSVRGFASSPELTRTNANGLYLFVNGRPVRDRLLRHALLESYRDLLPRGRFPIALLFVTISPDLVDVNVHPAKWEVRFADPQALHRLVRRAVRDAMTARSWLQTAPPGAAGGGGQPGKFDRVAERPAASDWMFASKSASASGGSDVSADRPEVVSSGPDEPLRFASLRWIGQLLASYLLLEGKGGLLLVDQHAAHERVLYERLRAEWLGRGVARQPLLIPETLELEPAAAAALEGEAEIAARLGFELEDFGPQTVVVRAIPAILSGRNPATLVPSLARELQAPELQRGSSPDETRLLGAADHLFATLACHSARRAGDHLEPDEQRALLESLDEIPWAPTCPHGRPVVIAVDSFELERRFRRR